MIKGIHITFFTPEAQELRAFIRDKLGFPFHDVGEGWLIFDLPAADMGCHPIGKEASELTDERGQVFHELSFYCDDIYETVAQLKERGVEFTSDIIDTGYGLSTRFRMPGDVELELYQPRYVKDPSA